MAENNDKKSSNQAFLQNFERQRLNKPCNRIIDLRGKVVGECQAYTFGERTHYLDDRAYLLAKQLLDRFDGRYTIGVYETLLKALKQLDQQQVETIPLNAEKEILKRDPTQPQLLVFDRQLQREETRIVYTSPVDIMIADVLYHASTVDLTTSAIRVSLRRAYTIDKGDSVNVTFTQFNEESGSDLLSEIAYKVVKIDHDAKRTYAILIRNRDDNHDVSAWLDNWTEAHDTIEYADLDDQISNLTNSFYLRLLTRSLNLPMFWLSHSQDESPIKAFHLMPSGEKVFEAIQNDDTKADLNLLPINTVMNMNTAYLVIVFKVKESLKSIAVPRNDANLVAKAINWHQRQQGSHVLLLQPETQQIDPSLFSTEMAIISDLDQDYAHDFSERLSAITKTITLADISSCCTNIKPDVAFSQDEIKSYIVANAAQSEPPSPSSLRHYIQRGFQRFFIRTAVTVNTGKQSFDVLTSDVSAEGMSLKLPGNIELIPETRITIDFTRWQSQTKEHKLTGISFVIKNKRFWDGETRLGMQRLVRSCSADVNEFFKSVLERNKDKVAANNFDVLLGQETRIFSSLLTSTLSTIPFYFGMDVDNKRIIQSIATTEHNRANEYDSLWPALAKMVTQLSEMLKNQPSRESSSVSFGLYCYQNNQNEWTINMEGALSSSAEKTLFISRALASKHYLFFQCSLMPLQANTLDHEVDLNEQLLQLRSQSSHKIKQIREILSSLFGVGNLVDITDIIEAAYR